MSIQTDDNTGLSDDSAVAQLVASLTPKASKSNVPPQDDDEDEDDIEDGEDDSSTDDTDGDEGDDSDADPDEGDDADEDDLGDDDGSNDEKPAPKAVPEDDAVVKVVVDGEETEVTVGSLKRLAGQEAALTRKSQEVEVVGGRAALMIQGAIEVVLEELAPYKDIDWLTLRDKMEPDEFEWHRDNFNKHQKRYQKLVGDAQNFEQIIEARQSAITREQAAEAAKELKAEIPEWSDNLYGEIMAYGIAEGLDEADVRRIANPKVIKLLRKAMLYDKGEKVVTKKVNQTPTRVKKTGGREALETVPSNRLKNLEKKLQSGRATDDDAIALLTGRWGVKSR